MSKNEQRKRAETIANLEKRIHETEDRVTLLIEQLQTATTEGAFDKIQSLSIEYEQTQATLDKLVAEWEEAHR